MLNFMKIYNIVSTTFHIITNITSKPHKFNLDQIFEQIFTNSILSQGNIDMTCEKSWILNKFTATVMKIFQQSKKK